MFRFKKPEFTNPYVDLSKLRKKAYLTPILFFSLFVSSTFFIHTAFAAVSEGCTLWDVNLECDLSGWMKFFMGDIGALALGAALGIVAIVVRQELVLFIMGGVFVMETFSVILQVTSYKLTGKRIFHMAPLHHHYELKGWPEPRVIVRFWIITVMLVLFGLATLKLR